MSHPVKRALLSVFDKQGIVPFARGLADAGVELVSSGGTARLLAENGLDVVAVADVTGFPEMLGGRVKTLHPAVHGGILAVRDDPQHMSDLRAQSIRPIDLVVVNLYPFTRTAATPGIGETEVVEMIDIGGPAMVRAAAKNFSDVAVVIDPADYEEVLASVAAGQPVSGSMRRRLATKAFRHTSDYDAAVASYLANGNGKGDTRPRDVPDDPAQFPDRFRLEYHKVQDLRYGENPHQAAAFYRDPLATGPSLGNARQLQGKELSFNNILDLDAALGLAADLRDPACVIIKHGNPCGAAVGPDPHAAFDAALACDPTSAFGGVIAYNRVVDLRAAEAMSEIFFEAIVAPSFDDEAVARLGKKKKLRLLETGDLKDFRRFGLDLRRVQGGLLTQDWDGPRKAVREGRVATRRAPTEEEWRGLEFAWTVCRHVKSNAIVYASSDRTLGVGAGQMSRVDSANFAVQKAQQSLEGCVMASDAFFPFRDGLDVGAEAGVKAVVQPGGSIRDDEVIAAADEHGIAMVFTGTRHFRH